MCCAVLSAVSEEAAFVQGFNDLEERTRKAVAEYVLTRCNIFAGKASLFSSRYDSASGLIE